MNPKETSPLTVIVRPKENTRKKSAGKGKAEKATTIPRTVHVVIREFVVPPSNNIQVVQVAMQIQMIDLK